MSVLHATCWGRKKRRGGWSESLWQNEFYVGRPSSCVSTGGYIHFSGVSNCALQNEEDEGGRKQARHHKEATDKVSVGQVWQMIENHTHSKCYETLWSRSAFIKSGKRSQGTHFNI